jgi:hypothetical protein
LSPIFGNKKENILKQQINKILSSEEVLRKDEYATGFLHLTANNLIWENKKGKTGSSIIFPLSSIQEVQSKYKFGSEWNLKVTYEESDKKKEKTIPLLHAKWHTTQKGEVEKWVEIIRRIKTGKIPSKQNTVESFDNIIYIGGHSSSSKKHNGVILLMENELIFKDNKQTDFVLRFPYQTIENLSTKTTTEINKLRTFLAGPLWSMGLRDKNQFVLIEYIDQVGMKQTPLFDSNNKTKDRLMKTLYEKIKKNKGQKMKKSTTNEDPVKVLKLRYAKGEISKEEYEEMKKTLEDT